MDRKAITNQLFELTEHYINPKRDSRIYMAKEVTFDYGTPNQVMVDYMQFKPLNNSISGIEKGDFYCYEIKSCMDDFNSGQRLNFIGDYNYIVTTEELYRELEEFRLLHHGVGFLVPAGNSLLSLKHARRYRRTRPTSEILLMMFRSANRENLRKERGNDRDNN